MDALDLFKQGGLLLLSALVDVPFFRLGARLLALRRLSFGATYLLALFASGSIALANLALMPVLPGLPDVAQDTVSFAASLAVSGWVVGYFMTTEERRSIGFFSGMKLMLVVNVLFLIVALLFSTLFGNLIRGEVS